MNKLNAKEFLPIVQALADGMEIEYRDPGGAVWRTLSEFSFHYPIECYRVKREPLVCYIAVKTERVTGPASSYIKSAPWSLSPSECAAGWRNVRLVEDTTWKENTNDQA